MLGLSGRSRSLALVLGTLAAGCHGSPPEGRYPCRVETVAVDCPPLWFCRADYTCWITPDLVDASSQLDAQPNADAGRVIDAAVGLDAARPLPDGCTCLSGTNVSCSTTCGSMGTAICTAACSIPTGTDCAPPAETCNLADDDCDGLIDEALTIAVSSATCIGTCSYATPTRVAPRVVALGDGTFDVVFSTGSGTQLQMQRLDARGSPMGAAASLGSDIAPNHSSSSYDVAYDGTSLLISYIQDMVPYLVAVSPTTGARIWGRTTIAMPPNRRVILTPRFTDVSPGRATLYLPQFPTSGGGGTYLRRYRFDVSGAAARIIDQVDAASDAVTTYDVETTADADIVVYVNATADIIAATGPRGDTTSASFSTLGAIQSASQQPNVIAVSIGVRSSTDPISAANPVVVAWQRDRGNGTFVATLTTTASSTPSAVLSLVGSNGSATSYSTIQSLVLRGTLPHAPMYVASLESDPAHPVAGVARLAVWELPVTGTPRQLDVPSEVSALRDEVSLAVSGTQLRIAAENDTGDITTRVIGCM